MKSSAFYAVIGMGVLLVAGIIWFGSHQIFSHKSSTRGTQQALIQQPLVQPKEGDSIFSSGTYGFTLYYPYAHIASTSFDSTYHLPSTWRVNAGPEATGTPLVSIISYSTQSNHSFPRYYESELRVGAATSVKAIAECLQVSDSESSLPDKVINGVTWKAFTLQSAGMMQYIKGISYRTIHDRACIAMELVATGSSYVDVPTVKDISQATLDAHYAELAPLVDTFAFVRP